MRLGAPESSLSTLSVRCCGDTTEGSSSIFAKRKTKVSIAYLTRRGGSVGEGKSDTFHVSFRELPILLEATDQVDEPIDGRQDCGSILANLMDHMNHTNILLPGKQQVWSWSLSPARVVVPFMPHPKGGPDDTRRKRNG